ncbi:AraC family transcriptional regulator [Pedobacter nutrimenti]|uniref:AraC family transcriptional regulator n=1 Tax=Pedobacter nutrimenti TaxID=1241337 RepID=UPI0029305839|nr:AraC family transcriptional regulator [Pedobacter nutrimenti]
MKALPFTILVPDDKSVISEQISLPHFYRYLHRHDEWQVTCIQSGEGTLIAGNDMHQFCPGDIFVIGAKLPHLFKSNPEYFLPDSELRVEACSIYFNPSGILAPLFSLPEMKTASLFLLRNKHGFKVPKRYGRKIAATMLDLHQTNGPDALFSFLNFINHLQGLGENIEPLCSATYSTDVSEGEGLRLSRIISFITENYDQPITLEDAANIGFMTRQSFCRYFKKHTGHTFVSFLNEVRINDARKNLLLRHKSDGISNIAYKAGFNSISNFNQVFKSVTGYTPSAYIDFYTNISQTDSDPVSQSF